MASKKKHLKRFLKSKKSTLLKASVILITVIFLSLLIPEKVGIREYQSKIIRHRPDTRLDERTAEDPGNGGMLPYFHYVDSSVNTANGNLFISENDISRPSLPQALTFSRSYNSMNSLSTTSVGYGWTHSYNSYLMPEEGMVTLFREDGAVFSFNENGTEFDTPPGLDALLTKNGTNFLLMYKNGMTFTYDRNGVLRNLYDRSGNKQNLNYKDDVLTHVKDINEQSLEFSYDASSRLIKVSDGTRDVTFEYDGGGRLIKATDASGNSTNYYYGPNNQLKVREDRRGKAVYYEYDQDSRAYEIGKAEGDLLFKSQTSHYLKYSISYVESGAELTNAMGHVWNINLDTDGRISGITDPLGYGTTVTFDENWNVDSAEDQMGSTQHFEYDNYNNMVTWTDPLGNAKAYTYEMFTVDFYYCPPATMTDENGKTWTYSYNSQGRLLEDKDPSGNSTLYTWTENGLLESITYPTGARTDYEYDNSGNLISTAMPNGLLVDYSYDSLGRMIKQKKGNRVTTHSYDLNNRLYRTNYPDNSYEVYEYDALGTIIKKRDQNGGIHEYDHGEKEVIIEEVLNGTEIYNARVNKIGDIQKEQNANGDITSYYYDPMGRLTMIKYPDKTYDSFSYDGAGRMTSAKDQMGFTTTYEYDAIGRLETERNHLGSTVTYSYDAAGRMTGFNDLNGGQWTYEYDAVGNMIKETDPAGYSQNYTYDAVGNRISREDKNGNMWEMEYDGMNLMTEMNHPDGAVESWSYDLYGDVTEHVDADGERWEFEYDSMGNMIKEIDPLGNFKGYSYDRLGNMLSYRDERGNRIRYQYDDLGNMISITDPLGRITEYEYDGEGNIIEMERPDGEEFTFTYDSFGRVLSQKTPWRTLSYGYDAGGNLISKTDPCGNAVRMEYDHNGLILKYTDEEGYSSNYRYDSDGNLIRYDDRKEGIHWWEYTRDAVGRVTMVEDPAGNSWRYSYDGEGNIVRIVDAAGNPASYSYDHMGNILSHTDAKENVEHFTYDGLGRMLSHTNAEGNTWNWSYDPFGNLLTETDPLGNTDEYQYDAAQNLIMEIDALGRETEYVYDEVERLTSIIDPMDNSKDFEYDTNDNIISVTDEKGNTETYAIDTQGAMLEMTTGEDNTYEYVRDAMGRVLEEIMPDGRTIFFKYDKRGNIVEKMVQGPGITGNDKIAYTYDGEENLLSVVNDFGEGETVTMQYDKLNRVEQIIQNWNPVESVVVMEYDAVGNIIRVSDSTVTMHYEYDENNMLTKIFDDYGHEVVYEYDKINRRTRIDYPNNMASIQSWDDANRMTRVQAVNTWDNVANNRTVVYDAVGNIINETENAGGQESSYWMSTEYDDLDRAVQTSINYTVGPSVVEYVYDAVGLLTSTIQHNDDGPDKYVNLSYDKENMAVGREATGEEDQVFVRDECGRLLETKEAVSGKVLESFAYDEFGRLYDIFIEGMGNHTSTLSALGWRVRDVKDDETDNFYYYFSGILGWFTKSEWGDWQENSAWTKYLIDTAQGLNNGEVVQYKYYQDYENDLWNGYYRSLDYDENSNVRTYYLFSSVDMFQRIPAEDSRSTGPSAKRQVNYGFFTMDIIVQPSGSSGSLIQVSINGPGGSMMNFAFESGYGFFEMCMALFFGALGEDIFTEPCSPGYEWYKQIETPEVTIAGERYTPEGKIKIKGPQPKKQKIPLKKNNKKKQKKIDLVGLLDDIMDDLMSELADHFIDEFVGNLMDNLANSVLDHFFGKAGKGLADDAKKIVGFLMDETGIKDKVADLIKGSDIVKGAIDKGKQMAKDIVHGAIDGAMRAIDAQLNALAAAMIKSCKIDMDKLRALADELLAKHVDKLKDKVGKLAEKAAEKIANSKPVQNGIKKVVGKVKKVLGKIVGKALKKIAKKAIAAGAKFVPVVGQIMQAWDVGWEIGTSIRGIPLPGGGTVGEAIDQWAVDEFTDAAVVVMDEVEANGGGASGLFYTWWDNWKIGVGLK